MLHRVRPSFLPRSLQPALLKAALRRRREVCALAAATLLGSCTSVAQDLDTVGVLYRDARYEASAAWLKYLARENASMSLRERARFYYLRGMTAYRLYSYSDALHDLALASSAVAATGDALSDEQRGILDQTLAELVLSTSYGSTTGAP